MTGAVRLTEEAGLFHEISIVTDAAKMLSALQSTHPKIPAEKNFIAHRMWLKDKLTTGVIDA